MIKQILSFFVITFLLGACVGGGVEANSAPLNAVSSLPTADLSAAVQSKSSSNEITTPESSDIENSEETVLGPATVKPESTPTAYPVQDKKSSEGDAYPAPIQVDRVQKPYPGPTDPIPSSPMSGYHIVNTFYHDPSAYTQGLVIAPNGTEFIEGTGLWGQSSLRRVDIETGQVVQFLALPDQYFGEGLTIFDDQILQLTWKSGVGFVYDSESFELLGEFYYPHEGWGITHDGNQLIISDGTATLHFWDPQTFTETKQLQVTDDYGPVTQLNELEYVNGEVWANVWFTDMIARISPDTGQVIGWIDLTGLYERGEQEPVNNVLNGIAYDDQTGRLFVTGKRWSSIFEITLTPTSS